LSLFSTSLLTIFSISFIEHFINMRLLLRFDPTKDAATQ
jgi:hypothetical protein